mmetsp:Transcript_13708/g.31623  ORF Transcript_13708/g.31623 Transcript_13708/m.31623 type:complete len:243 (-) Transcript_13708:738-1466(-)
MSFLIFKCRRHQEWENLVEQRSRSKFSCFIRNLSQSLLPHWRCAVLHLQQQFHDFSFVSFIFGQLIFVNRLIQKRCKKLIILRLYKRQIGWSRRHTIGIFWLFSRDLIRRSSSWSRRCQQFPRGGLERLVTRWRLQDLVPFGWEKCIQFFIHPRPVSVVDIPLETELLQLLWCQCREMTGSHHIYPSKRRCSHQRCCPTKHNWGFVPSRSHFLLTASWCCVWADSLRCFIPPVFAGSNHRCS